MKNILLVCSAGLTSAKVVSSMKNTAENKYNDELNIWSTGVAGVKEESKNADVILFSPQSAYLKDTVSEFTDESKILKIIPTELYTNLDGVSIIDFALEK